MSLSYGNKSYLPLSPLPEKERKSILRKCMYKKNLCNGWILPTLILSQEVVGKSQGKEKPTPFLNKFELFETT